MRPGNFCKRRGIKNPGKASVFKKEAVLLMAKNKISTFNRATAKPFYAAFFTLLSASFVYCLPAVALAKAGLTRVALAKAGLTAIALAAAVVLPFPANAAGIDFSMYVTEGINEPVRGDHQVRFAIYSADRTELDPYPSNTDAAQRVWQETQTANLNYGLLKTTLGKNNPFPSDLDFQENTYYLGIRIGNDAELVPRKQLSPNPMAYSAVESQTSQNAQALQNRTIGEEEDNIMLLGPGGEIEEQYLSNEISFLGQEIDISDQTNLETEGSLLSLQGDTLSVAAGTLIDGRFCTYNSENGLVCDTSINSVMDATTTGTTGTTASNSGLEATDEGMRLLGGCSSGQILTWNASEERWQCTTNTAGSSDWTDTGSLTYLTKEVNDFAIGGSAPDNSAFGIDADANSIYIGSDNSSDSEIIFGSAAGDEGSLKFNSNSAFYFSGASVGVGTADPNEVLDINGRLYIRDAAAPASTSNRLYSLDGSLHWNGSDLAANTHLSEDDVETYIFDADNAGTLSSGTLSLGKLSYAGLLPVSAGGTNSATLGDPGSLSYSDGEKYSFTAQGSQDQVLVSQGASSPIWQAISGGEGGLISPDSLNFTEFSNSLIVDADTAIDTSSHSLTVNGTFSATALEASQLTINGSATLGSAGENITLNSSLIPSTDSLNLGSSSNHWSNIYVDNLSVDSTNTNGTTAEYFTINSEGSDQEDMGLRFYLGPTANTHGGLFYDGDNQHFSFYQREDTQTLGQLNAASLGIGTTDPQAALDVYNNFTVTSAGAVTVSSFTDGTLAISSGNLSTSGTLEAGAFTDGVFSVTGGVITGAAWQGNTIAPQYGGTGTSTQFDSGSIIFAGASGVYSQDNSNFFWDDTNDYLGIGNSSPEAALHIGTQSPSGLTTYGDSVMISGALEVGETFYAGPTEFAADAGVISWTDMPVTSAPAAGTAQSYTARIDGESLLTVYAEADGSGGIQNQGIGISEMNPAGLLHVGATSPFVVDSAGNVGIGTTSPANKLAVSGGLSVGTTDPASSYLSTAAPDGGAIFEGNVGIGRTNPTLQLEVDGSSNGGIYVNGTNSGDTDPRIIMEAGGRWGIGLQNTNKFVIGTGGGHSVGSSVFFDKGVYLALESSNYYAGFGDLYPDAHLEVSAKGGTGGNIFLLSSNDDNDGDIMTVTEFGNVGIGTTSPSTHLDVAGGFRVDEGALEYDESTGITSIDNIGLGSLSFDTDAGIVNWVDLSVSSTPAAGDPQSYTAQIDGNPLLTVYAEADGSGGIQNQGIGINEMNPAGLLHVGSTEPFLLSSAGNLGLGNTSPNERLHVGGADPRIYLADASAPGTTANRLYSTSGTLYWDGTDLTIGEEAKWDNTFTSEETWTPISGLSSTKSFGVSVDASGLTGGGKVEVRKDGFLQATVNLGESFYSTYETDSSVSIGLTPTVTNTYDITTATLSTSMDMQDNESTGIAWNNDGTKLYEIGYSSDKIYEYSLSTPYDVTTSAFVASISTQDSYSTDISWNNDGTKVYEVGIGNNKIYEYDVSVPYDITTASFSTSIDSNSGQISDLIWNNDGTKMYELSNGSDKIYEHTLSIPYDITTATVVASKNTQNVNPRGIAWNNDGTKLYEIDRYVDTIYEYNVSTPYDIFTASLSTSIETQDTSATDIIWNNDGSKMYELGENTDKIYEYDVGNEGNITGTVYASVNPVDKNLWAESGSDLHYISGNVGIGTTGPSYKLDVDGTAQATGFRTNAETVTDWTGTGITLSSGAITATLGQTIEFSEIASSDIITQAEGIAANDNDTTLATSAAIKDYADSNDADTTYTAGSGLTLGSGAFELGGTLTKNSSLNFYGSAADRDFRFYNSDSSDELLFLQGSTGNLGIGTQAPSSKLDVSGSARIYDQTVSTGSTTLTVRAGAGQATDPLFQWQNNSGTGLGVIDENGNVGIGTTGPEGILDILGDSQTVFLQPAGITTDGGLKNSPVLRLRGKYDSDGTTGVASANYNFDLVNTMTAGGTAPASRLGIKNNAGTEVMSVLNNGNVGIGDTDPSYTFTVDHDGDGVNVAYVDENNTWASGSADYAEYYYTEDTDLESGEAVCIDLTRENAVKRCPRQRDPNLMGIVSSSPAFLGNAPAEEKREDNDNYKIIGMLGQVPAKVTDENGPIRSGDSLTSASKPGYLMKAGPGDSTVGVALEKQKDNSKKINVLISRRNQSLTVEQVESQIQDRIAQMEIEDEVDILVSQAINNLSLSETFNFDPGQIAQDIENNTDKIKVINSQFADYQKEVDDRLANYESQITNHKNEVNSRFETQDSRLKNQDKRLEELTATIDSLNETDSYLIDLAASNETRISDLETSILEDNLDSETAISARITQILQSLGESLEENILDERGNKLFTLTASMEIINLKAQKVEAGEVQADNVTTAGVNTQELKMDQEISGKEVIPAGETSVTIQTAKVRQSSKIIITPAGSTAGKILYTDEIRTEESFQVRFDGDAITREIKFDWMIVN
ncbi:MAG: hypothetical protein U5L10_01425 [Candidatus Moranbacteria bacterium]|nr:hypothetical protein [Candidatus Moranbacteria bacterium]